MKSKRWSRAGCTAFLSFSLSALLAPSLAQAAIPASERQVLINLYNQTNGSAWLQNANWRVGSGFNAPGTECTWLGIECDASETHVTKIRLSFNNLQGPLPALDGLTELQWFIAASNELTGPIPPLANLQKLEAVDLQQNRLTGNIPSLTGLTALNEFLVAHNNLEGSIPSLSGLTALAIFDVSSNLLTGNIPPLTGLSALDHFDADSNNLSGPIPTLAGLNNLKVFRVNGNRLTGTIPSLEQLDLLWQFDVSSNNLTGDIPVLPVSGTLEHLNLSYNRLTGGLSNLGSTYLWDLNINDNLFSGPMPSQWGARILRIENNYFTGEPPTPDSSLQQATLCPNYLVPSSDPAINTDWDALTSTTPWHQDCTGAAALYPIAATADPATGGSVTCTPNPVPNGGNASCTATPNSGYTFSGFSGACTGSTCDLTNVTAPQSVTATFAASPVTPAPVRSFSGTTVPPSGSGGTATATFTGGGSACTFDPANTGFIAAPAGAPAGRQLPQGLFRFTLTGCDTSPVTMTVTWPEPVADVIKYGPQTASAAPGYYSHPQASASGSVTTIVLNDGQLGDADWSVNGTIVDPIGPITAVVTPPGSGGDVTPVPTLGHWALALLAALTAGLGLRNTRRRQA